MKCIHNDDGICDPCKAEVDAGKGNFIMQPGWAEPSGTLTYSGRWDHTISKMIDYKALLEKYIVMVGMAEGTDFIDAPLDIPLHLGTLEMSVEEQAELYRISRKL